MGEDLIESKGSARYGLQRFLTVYLLHLGFLRMLQDQWAGPRNAAQLPVPWGRLSYEVVGMCLVMLLLLQLHLLTDREPDCIVLTIELV
jgi:hypothetical protein